MRVADVFEGTQQTLCSILREDLPFQQAVLTHQERKSSIKGSISEEDFVQEELDAKVGSNLEQVGDTPSIQTQHAVGANDALRRVVGVEI